LNLIGSSFISYFDRLFLLKNQKSELIINAPYKISPARDAGPFLQGESEASDMMKTILSVLAKFCFGMGYHGTYAGNFWCMTHYGSMVEAQAVHQRA
jgi:hypothetical protein